MKNLKSLLKALQKGPRTFSDLKNSTDLANGVIQHHTNNSTEIVRKKKALMLKDQCRSCKLKDVCQERCVASLMNDKEKKQILKLFENGLSQRKIAERLNKSPSTVNYHLDRLRQFNMVEGEEIKEEVRNHLEL